MQYPDQARLPKPPAEPPQPIRSNLTPEQQALMAKLPQEFLASLNKGLAMSTEEKAQLRKPPAPR